MKQYDKSVNDLNIFLKQNPKSYLAYYYRSLNYEKLYYYQTALIDVYKALYIKPGFRPTIILRNKLNHTIGYNEIDIFFNVVLNFQKLGTAILMN